MTEFEKCNECDQRAIWFYCSGNERIYCDDCVPRVPCSCNLRYPEGCTLEEIESGKFSDDLVYYKDSLGRHMPCADFSYYDPEELEEYDVNEWEKSI